MTNIIRFTFQKNNMEELYRNNESIINYNIKNDKDLFLTQYGHLPIYVINEDLNKLKIKHNNSNYYSIFTDGIFEYTPEFTLNKLINIKNDIEFIYIHNDQSSYEWFQPLSLGIKSELKKTKNDYDNKINSTTNQFYNIINDLKNKIANLENKVTYLESKNEYKFNYDNEKNKNLYIMYKL
jgi:hypothetical protein